MCEIKEYVVERERERGKRTYRPRPLITYRDVCWRWDKTVEAETCSRQTRPHALHILEFEIDCEFDLETFLITLIV